MNKNRDKIVLDSILGGATFGELSEELKVSITRIREIFYRQVKRAMPELFENKTPTIRELRLISHDVKERVHSRLVNSDINTPDIHQQINDAIRLLVDVGYSVSKSHIE